MEIESIRREEIRCRIMQVLDANRPFVTLESLLLRSLERYELGIDLNRLRSELKYLQDKRVVENVAPQSESFKPVLTAYGVDLLEGNTEMPPGLSQVKPLLGEAELLRRQEIRWRMLRVADAARPGRVTEQLVWRTLDDCDLLTTKQELRRTMCYLAGKGLLDVEMGKSPEQDWKVSLTAAGVDVVEYTTDCPVGIARPPKYWVE